jgi:hypothetical protein
MISQTRALTRGYRSVIVRRSRISPQFVMNPGVQSLLRPCWIAVCRASTNSQKRSGHTRQPLLDKASRNTSTTLPLKDGESQIVAEGLVARVE